MTLDAAGAGIGIAFLIIWLVILVVAFGGWIVSILGLVDNGKHSEQAYVAAGTTKQTALILCIVGLVACAPVGIYYWFAVRPKVVAADGGGAG